MLFQDDFRILFPTLKLKLLYVEIADNISIVFFLRHCPTCIIVASFSYILFTIPTFNNIILFQKEGQRIIL